MAVTYYDAQAKLSDLIQAGANDDTMANCLRDISKIVVITAAAYAALPVKDANTIYMVI